MIPSRWLGLHEEMLGMLVYIQHTTNGGMPKSDPAQSFILQSLHNQLCLCLLKICIMLYLSCYKKKSEWVTPSQANLLLFGSLLIWRKLVWHDNILGVGLWIFAVFSPFFLILSLLSWCISVSHCQRSPNTQQVLLCIIGTVGQS